MGFSRYGTPARRLITYIYGRGVRRYTTPFESLEGRLYDRDDLAQMDGFAGRADLCSKNYRALVRDRDTRLGKDFDWLADAETWLYNRLADGINARRGAGVR